MNGIYWDCDGTLMDTETSYGLAWKEHLSDFGLEISEEETRNGWVLTIDWFTAFMQKMWI